jgi:hypothetical protein
MSETAQQILLLFDRGDRAEAKRRLRNMGVEALPVLRELLERPLQAEKKSRLLYWLLPMLATPLLMIPLFGPPETTQRISSSWYQEMTWTGWLFTYIFYSINPGIFVAFGFNALLLRNKQNVTREQVQELSAHILAQVNDEGAIGLLLEITHWLKERLSESTLNACREALIRQLPRLSSETAILLTRDQRRALLGLLETHSWFTYHIESEESTPRGIPNSRYDVPLSLAILRVYTLIGDPQALKYVERLTTAVSRPHLSPEGKRVKNSAERVKEAADACLPKLRERCEALRTGESLLRAASKPEAAPEELLRPAQGSKETSREQLLRASLGHSDSSCE